MLKIDLSWCFCKSLICLLRCKVSGLDFTRCALLRGKGSSNLSTEAMLVSIFWLLRTLLSRGRSSLISDALREQPWLSDRLVDPGLVLRWPVLLPGQDSMKACPTLDESRNLPIDEAMRGKVPV